MDHEIQLLADLAGEPPAEVAEEPVEIGESVEPLVAIPRERPLHPAPIDVEPGEVEAVRGGNEAERRLHGLAATMDAIDHPLEDARVLAVARPEEAPFRVAPEPVHAEDLGRMDEARAHGEPMGEVVAHVVAAERDHGHGIA